jgi:hypothetical protein
VAERTAYEDGGAPNFAARGERKSALCLLRATKSALPAGRRCRSGRRCRRTFLRSTEPISPNSPANGDAFNHGGTPEFAAISAVARHHNDISNTLSTAPHRFQPMHRRKPNGDVDARPWCRGFHAARQPRLPAWAPLLDLSNINHGLLLPILLHCIDDYGRPLLGPAKKGA